LAKKLIVSSAVLATPSAKRDYPALLPVGFHRVPVKALRKLCVDSFSLSPTREPIMQALEGVIRRLKRAKINGQLWVNGSFLTAKIDPEDADVVLYVASEVYDNGSAPQRTAISWVNANLKSAGLPCDTYVCFRYRKAHPCYAEGVFMRAYWMRQWGFDRSQGFKGVAVVKL
jgi:hypothetical protein